MVTRPRNAEPGTALTTPWSSGLAKRRQRITAVQRTPQARVHLTVHRGGPYSPRAHEWPSGRGAGAKPDAVSVCWDALRHGRRDGGDRGHGRARRCPLPPAPDAVDRRGHADGRPRSWTDWRRALAVAPYPYRSRRAERPDAAALVLAGLALGAGLRPARKLAALVWRSLRRRRGGADFLRCPPRIRTARRLGGGTVPRAVAQRLHDGGGDPGLSVVPANQRRGTAERGRDCLCRDVAA